MGHLYCIAGPKVLFQVAQASFWLTGGYRAQITSKLLWGPWAYIPPLSHCTRVPRCLKNKAKKCHLHRLAQVSWLEASLRSNFSPIMQYLWIIMCLFLCLMFMFSNLYSTFTSNFIISDLSLLVNGWALLPQINFELVLFQCKSDEFTCNDGTCINLDYRSDIHHNLGLSQLLVGFSFFSVRAIWPLVLGNEVE